MTDRELYDFLVQLDERFHRAESIVEHIPLHHNYHLSAKNLAKYLILRSLDIRNIQNQLHHRGLSSLAASESHIHYQLHRVIKWLNPSHSCTWCQLSDVEGRSLTINRSQELFGVKRSDTKIPYLMVTLDERKSQEIKYFEKLLVNGMNIARINFAHANKITAVNMVETLRAASLHTGNECKVYMDLAGPKLRAIIPNKKRKIKLLAGETIQLLSADTARIPEKKAMLVEESKIFETLMPGHRIYFDDGKFYGIIEEVEDAKAVVRIIRTPLNDAILKQGKGINLPDTPLHTPSLTPDDLNNLEIAHQYADIVGYSFVRRPEDIQLLRRYLSEYGISKPIIYKIETSEAVQHIVDLLLEAMKDPLFGIMIARGDLAIEIGFERLAEIQEELLWLSEAAHTPVIWATQVLESFNKTGLMTRSEISDVVMASMSECVMLNKGKNIHQTLLTLKDILHRESAHREKKRFTMRQLNIVQKFVQSNSL